MNHFLAIFLRSLVLCALIANGTLASVHGHAVALDAATSGRAPATQVMPCHEEMATETLQSPLETPGRSAAQHTCCDADCVCDFVISTAIAAVAWMPDAMPVESLAPTFSIGELPSPHSPRLLRPPIA